MIKIKNNFQLAASRKWLAQIEKSLEDAKQNSRNIQTRLYQAQVEGIRSQINDLKREIDEYESLRDAQPGEVIVESLEDLPDALIRVRIARHFTQEHLAEKLGVRPQQVQKWEAGAYQRASYASILKVARALGIEMEGTTL